MTLLTKLNDVVFEVELMVAITSSSSFPCQVASKIYNLRAPQRLLLVQPEKVLTGRAHLGL